MEAAHLTKAHEHVRNAATATYSNSIVTAGTEHERAASSFRDAAQDTNNSEALRILALLEDHHHKLANLIKEPPRHSYTNKDSSRSPSTVSDASTNSPQQKVSPSRTASPSTSTRAPSRRRLPQSSIASNLAEKRGIPGVRRSATSLSPISVTNALAAHNEQPPSSVREMLQEHVRKAGTSRDRDSERPDKSPMGKDVNVQQEMIPLPEDNFKRFYSAFGGVISAISAPLAFTSLPLNPLASPAKEESVPSPATQTKQKAKTKPEPLETSRTLGSSEPDLAALISKPALRALREDHSTPLGPFANNESFYFVPTSGGTVSYASILRDPQAHPHHAAQDPHLDSIAEDNNEGGLRGSSHEEFVDARENVGPPSPTAPRRPRSSKGSSSFTSNPSSLTTTPTIRAGRGQGLKTMEELQLENDTLRTLIDKQSKRLSMWETTSQSSYNALAQSFRVRGNGLKQQLSDPSALAQALAMGSNAVPLPSPPPIPVTSSQYQPESQPAPSSAQSTETTKRLAELEALLATQAAQINTMATEKEHLNRQNEKHVQVIARYREQWEKLKAGARKKEQERRERRVEELKAEEGRGKDSESGEATGEGEEAIESEEPGFGKA